MDGDSPVNIPISSDTITISSPFGDVASGHLTGSMTLGPVAPTSGSIAGLGGADALLNVSGGDLTAIANPVNPRSSFRTRASPSGRPSQTIVASIQIPSDASAPVHLDLSPVYQWLDTSADVNFVINLEGVLGIFGDPDPISVFSGSLGPLYTSAGLDTQVLGRRLGGDRVRPRLRYRRSPRVAFRCRCSIPRSRSVSTVPRVRDSRVYDRD